MTIFHCGLDVGSTTVKAVVEDGNDEIVFSTYRRHYSDIRRSVFTLLREIGASLHAPTMTLCVTGSAGMGLAERLGLPFCQEVIASTRAVETYLPQTDVAIELGGEDAKITFFGGSLDQRMNGTCAGGTGAFIDQMATLLDTDADGLNALAMEHRMIYPIAARCGVFAKTDIQPLLNEGARHEDIAASILQAVVNQTVSVLACGHPIRGKVAFLGGPLHFLPSLRQRFIETLKLGPNDVLVPENANLFVAMGASRLSREQRAISFDELLERMNACPDEATTEVRRLEPLFRDEAEYDAFLAEHADEARRGDLANYAGRVFLGIDAGSTTSKVVLIGEDREILFSYYGSNEGKPLDKTIEILRTLYAQMPETAVLANACVTGYGEGLIQKALNVDLGEIETIAHYKAADYFLPNVDFILDIGGQDMKCMVLRNGVIESILLNEACSSGCGSFIETFAKSLGHTAQTFAKEALFAENPVDLGTRCTVFMNSRVKQAQKEGASVGDISAGLSYSVIKNALYKVIKLRDPSSVGQRVIVQGGAFHNDAILRAFERISGLKAVRPNIAGLMGAFGCALIAQERCAEDQHVSAIRPANELAEFKNKITMTRCQGCGNHCLLTINAFSDGSRFVTGNRCDRPVGGTNKSKVPNLFDYKHKRTFAYASLAPEQARRGSVGLPRVLNMYENYPFWHTFFTQLGFRVILSPQSSRAIYELGIETIPSESACYPAKLVHGHIQWLIDQKPDFIFYPCVAYEQKDIKSANNHFNCPIVTSYPEVIRNNVDALEEQGVTFMHPFLNLDAREELANRLFDEFRKSFNVDRKEVRAAVKAAYAEYDAYKADIRHAADEALDYMRDHHCRGIVLGGRPYHIDREINHGIPEMIAGFGIVVFTEDSVFLRGDTGEKLRVFDQWAYHSRLYTAARFASVTPNLEFIQLNSFGCGLDAVTTDQVMEIIQNHGKIYTSLKIDEGNNIGAARIRVRSLIAALNERDRRQVGRVLPKELYPSVPFTVEMRKTYNIIAPQMSPIHFRLLEKAFRDSNYNFVILGKNGVDDRAAVDEGLKYVNNDACYPSIITTGQIIHALKSGDFNPHQTAVFCTQTGGGCRATNYVAFIRKALREAGFSYVPVVPLSAQGFEKHPGFSFELPLVKRTLQAFIYGDALMRCLYRVRPYEKVPGSANALYEKWNAICCQALEKADFAQFSKNCAGIVEAFDALEITNVRKPRVGVVGEILVKYHPGANNNIVDVLEREGAEAVVPDLMGFFLYTISDAIFNYENLAMPLKSAFACRSAVKMIEYFQHPLFKALNASKRFEAPLSIDKIAKMTSPILSIGNTTGEGWFLTGEMLELIHTGVPNILCLQPFACLPNHVTGKGMIKKIRELHPTANIAPIDYDPGASEVNQLNRIKLMLSVAFRNLQKEGEVIYLHNHSSVATELRGG